MMKKSIVYLYMSMYLLFGAATTVLIKQMDLIAISNHSFAHPYIQCSYSFLGQSICLVVYSTYKCIKKKKVRTSDYRQFRKKHSISLPNFYRRLGVMSFGIPGLLYIFSIYLMFIGLFLSAPSVYQIIRGVITVPVLIFSLIFLKRKFYKHHILGVFCILTGAVVVGIDSILEKSSSSSDPIIGGIVLLISQIIAGAVLVFEEYLMSKIYIEPIQAIGVEGAVGLSISLLVLFVLNFIPCENQDFCYGGKVENTLEVLDDLVNNWQIMVLVLGSVLAIAVLYWAGIYTTRYASALSRATMDSARIVVVWAFSLAFGWESFHWVELIGFLIMVFGTLVYNEIFIIPLFGLKEAVEMHRVEENSSLSEF